MDGVRTGEPYRSVAESAGWFDIPAIAGCREPGDDRDAGEPRRLEAMLMAALEPRSGARGGLPSAELGGGPENHHGPVAKPTVVSAGWQPLMDHARVQV